MGLCVVGLRVVGLFVVGLLDGRRVGMDVGLRVVGLRVVGLLVVGLIVVGLLDGRRVGMEMAVLLCVSLRRSPSTAVPNNRPMTTTAWIKKLVMIGLIDDG